MRTDVFDFIRTIIMEGLKPNYYKIARRFNCDSRTVKRYYLKQTLNTRKPQRKSRVLEPYSETIKENLLNLFALKVYIIL